VTMTPHEIELAKALGRCSFLPGTSQKRFCRNMSAMAENAPNHDVTLRQRHYMEIMAWRMRRQMPAHLVPYAKPVVGQFES
jgi:hypothetical protein